MLGLRGRCHRTAWQHARPLACGVATPAMPADESRRIRPGPMMERRVLFAALLTALFLSFYGQMLGKWSGVPTQKPVGTSPGASVPGKTSLGSFIGDGRETQHYEKEEVITISSERLALKIGRQTGAIKDVVLRKFLDQKTRDALRISGKTPLFLLRSVTQPLEWNLVETTQSSATLESTGSDTGTYRLRYELDQQEPVVRVSLVYKKQHPGMLEDISRFVLVNSWEKAEDAPNRYNQLEVIAVTDGFGGKAKYRRYIQRGRPTESVPRGTMRLTLCEHYFCQSIQYDKASVEGRITRSLGQEVIVESSFDQPRPGTEEGGFSATVYFGPRDFFQRKQAGFEQALPMGTLEKIGLMLLMLLRGIAKLTGSYGIGLILLGGIVTCLLAPFTLASFRSMKKLAELRPRTEKIMAQHKDDPQRANREIFALYKEHRVNPMGGCLPMLLQFPILMALFSAIPNFIDLRGQSFLWIKDLSRPDRIARLPIELPVLGGELHLLPILMAAAMYAQMKLSQQQVPQDQSNPMTKAMSGPMMSVVFGLMFYQAQSGLVLYWLTNSLISAVWYKLAR